MRQVRVAPPASLWRVCAPGRSAARLSSQCRFRLRQDSACGVQTTDPRRLFDVAQGKRRQHNSRVGMGVDPCEVEVEGGATKSENCKTNPILFKPAWKNVENEAKNEPKSIQSVLWANCVAKSHGDRRLGKYRPEKAGEAVWGGFGLRFGSRRV